MYCLYSCNWHDWNPISLLPLTLLLSLFIHIKIDIHIFQKITRKRCYTTCSLIFVLKKKERYKVSKRQVGSRKLTRRPWERTQQQNNQWCNLSLRDTFIRLYFYCVWMYIRRDERQNLTVDDVANTHATAAEMQTRTFQYFKHIHSCICNYTSWTVPNLRTLNFFILFDSTIRCLDKWEHESSVTI